MDRPEQAEFIYQNVRLRTLPVGAAFLADAGSLPASARRPSVFLKKRVTICQVMTMARNYGWEMGVTAEDLICPLAGLAFGFLEATDPAAEMAAGFLKSQYKLDLDKARSEVEQMCFLEKGAVQALYIAPLRKMALPPDTVVLYGSPGQMSRLVQAATYDTQERIQGLFGGKVECPEYLIRPMRTGAPRIVLPGPGDRIFSMTADDEMIFAFPAAFLEALVTGLKESGRKAGARYPITFYQNFQPEFPPHYKELAEKYGLC